MIARREVTRHILKSFDLHASKRLGQNFLVEPNVVGAIVDAAAISPGETVLEIGPGIGTLTQGLLEKGAHVVAVELDKRLLEVLSHTLSGYENVRILHGDILKVDIPALTERRPFKVVANLPYYITTPILMTLLERRLPATRLVTMVQKEVADRMAAKPGGKAYGALSVAIQYYTEPQPVLLVPPRAFLPPPAVDSVVVCCKARPQPAVLVKNENLFFRTVRAAFSQRRKTLQNALRTMGISKEAIAAALEDAAIDGARRGETLSLEEFAALADRLEIG